MAEDILAGLEKTTAYLLQVHNDTTLTREMIAIAVKAGVEQFGLTPKQAIGLFTYELNEEFGCENQTIPLEVAGEILDMSPTEVAQKIKESGGSIISQAYSWTDGFTKKKYPT